jgi:hypothetical protein
MSSSRSLSCSGSTSSTTCIKAQYEHGPLDRTTDSFRLIKVLPKLTQDGLLQISLWHDNVSSVSYRCLSYRWGDQAQRHTVLINGLSFSVGENLYDFLEEAQSWSESLSALWIDSICINQQCVQERGHQVQHMGSIYVNAEEVLIWLGRKTLFARSLCDWIQAENWTECPDSLRQQWDAIRFNPYWCRAWIVQEVLLARSIMVILPGVRLDYNLIGRAITRSADLTRLDEDAGAQLWSFWYERRKKACQLTGDPVTVDWIRHQRDGVGFWDLIQMHKKAKCTDERDRIYSLLGLISGDHEFKVDYSESTADLFWRAGEHFDAWEAPELVDILRVALLCNNSQKNGVGKAKNRGISPWVLIESLKEQPDFQVRIPIRRTCPTTSMFSRVTKQPRCGFKECRRVRTELRCNSNDVLLCTNALSSGPTEHGCIHALASPTDSPAAEPFEIRMEAHHGKILAHTVLPPTAVQVFDEGTSTWVGVSTWSSLRKALNKRNLDRMDLVKLQVPAKYAIWTWFGVHPDHLETALVEHHPELPSAHHALPSGTKVTRNSIEVPCRSIGASGEVHAARKGIFDI